MNNMEAHFQKKKKERDENVAVITKNITIEIQNDEIKRHNYEIVILFFPSY